MKFYTKTVAARALAASGALRVAESFAARRGAVIFMLHRVLPTAEMEECYNSALAITPESFDAFLAWLADNYRVVDLDDLNKTRGPACCLTFDDGWEDNHRFAFPLLRKHKVPATIFLVSSLIGSDSTLPEERLIRVWKAAPSGVTEALRLERDASYATVSQRAKQLPITQKLELLGRLEAEFGPAPLKRRFMTWGEVRDMGHAGVRFGSHTARHATLGVETEAVIREELGNSLQEITGQLPDAVLWLAYPNGAYDERVVAAAKELGYFGALTTATGRVDPAGDPFRLPRIAIDNGVVNDANGAFSAARLRLHVVRGSLWPTVSAY